MCGGGLRVLPLGRVGFHLATSTFVLVNCEIVFDIFITDEMDGPRLLVKPRIHNDLVLQSLPAATACQIAIPFLRASGRLHPRCPPINYFLAVDASIVPKSALNVI